MIFQEVQCILIILSYSYKNPWKNLEKLTPFNKLIYNTNYISHLMKKGIHPITNNTFLIDKNLITHRVNTSIGANFLSENFSYLNSTNNSLLSLLIKPTKFNKNVRTRHTVKNSRKLRFKKKTYKKKRPK